MKNMSKMFTVNNQDTALTSTEVILVSLLLTLNKRNASSVLLESIGVQYLEMCI